MIFSNKADKAALKKCESCNEDLADALDHIIRVCRASRTQTRRTRWIAERAQCAIDGTADWKDLDLPKSVQTDTKRVRSLAAEVKQLSAQNARLRAACLLGMDMMTANDCSLPKTFATMREAMSEDPATAFDQLEAEAFMAGQADCGVDPSYSSALNYVNRIRHIPKTSGEDRDDL